MHHVIVAGAGKIGNIIAHILASSGEYHVLLADQDFNQLAEGTTQKNIDTVNLNIEDTNALDTLVKQYKIEAVISSLPYFLNIPVATWAKKAGIHYFDLTEDREVSDAITQLSQDSQHAFVSQCGLAPGLIDIIANDIMQHFDKLETVKLRCGALPSTSSNTLGYALTWSVDGLINEYGNPCDAIESGQRVSLPPLSNLEDIQLDGMSYEAFNTSGGIGTLAESYAGQINDLNYKTIRYPGHCEKMRFLMKELKLNQDRDTLKTILLRSIPYTHQDVVLVYVSVNGYKNDKLTKESFDKKYYPKEINGLMCTAIQLTTACSACAVIDIVLEKPKHFHGRVTQENFSLKDILHNRFGSHLND